MFEIWGRDNSVNVQKVLWCCDELRLTFDRIDAGGPFGRTDEPEYRRLNPTGFVPTLVDGDFTLWESNAIVRHLARCHDRDQMMPNDAYDKARVDQWMDWQSATFWPVFRPVFIGLIRTSVEQRDTAAIAEAIARSTMMMRVLDTHLQDRRFILGDRFTVADIALGPPIHRWFTLDIERPDLPALSDWYRRLCDRESYRQRIVSIELT